MKAKTASRSSKTAGIGKPGGNKNIDDRQNIDKMRTLLTQARSKN